MTLQEKLIASGEELEKRGTAYYEKSAAYAELEEKFKNMRADLYQLDNVAGLGNQSLRDAEADKIMQNDDRFRPLYFDYTTAKMESKKAWIMYEVQKEINDNLRVLVNNLTFMKGGQNE